MADIKAGMFSDGHCATVREQPAFGFMREKTNLGFSENVTSIGDYAFSGCTALSSLTLPESLKSMGYYVIESTAISSITIPKNVSSSTYSNSNHAGNDTHNGASANCKSLTEVVFEDGMTKIPDYICASPSYTSYITKVIIPDDEKKTIQVLIGFDDFSGSAKLNLSENSTAYWSESCK